MNEQRFEPEEFERLLALPEGHPERMSAERSGRLLAWKQMLDGFESPPDVLFTPQELARARRNWRHVSNGPWRPCRCLRVLPRATLRGLRGC